ncbi:hypothetical protein BRARA_G00176, partial [Brassica rapa]
ALYSRPSYARPVRILTLCRRRIGKTRLSMMRTYTKKKDIVRPGATRFATYFLTLQSIYEKKGQLKNIFNSDEWHDFKHFKFVKGKTASDTVMSYIFWNSVMVILKVFSLMVKVLRLADGEKIPSLGFVYGEFWEAKKFIKEATDHLEKKYQRVFKIIDEKMKGVLIILCIWLLTSSTLIII